MVTQAEADRANANRNEPFGWNRGSVRALLVVMLLVALVLFVGIVIVVTVLRADEKFLEQIVLLLAGAFIGAVNIAITWYFANRPPSGA